MPAGNVVHAILPDTGSDPVAPVVQFVVAFGSVIGRGAHVCVEADRHHTNMSVGAVGARAKVCKGTSWDHVRRLFAAVDADRAKDRLLGGRSSGEG